MMDMERDATARTSPWQPPEWLKRVLLAVDDLEAFSAPTVSPPAEGFVTRCRLAGETAAAIVKLRRERSRIGFVPMSFADYVQGLTKVARVPLPSVLEFFGIGDLTQIGPMSVAGWASLGRSIGLSAREMLAHMRIAFAGQQDMAPIPLLIAHARSGPTQRDPLEECEEMLLRLESGYAPDQRRQLALVETQIRLGYAVPKRSRDDAIVR